MASLITSLYTGASGVYTNQTAVQVTGNNISNASTEGYSRQDATITSATSLSQGNLVYGTGSLVDSIKRVEDPFITEQLISQSADYGEYNAKSSPLQDIEELLAIDEAALSGDIDAFFDAWSELAANPDGTTERQQVILEAENIVYQANQISQQFADITTSINEDLEAIVPEVNDLLEQIASLNKSIQKAELSGSDANTLRDERDLLTQQVSESIGATSYTDEDGMVCLQLENGLPLVIADQATTLSTQQVDGNTELYLTSGSRTYSLTSEDFGGAVKGLMAVRDEVIPELVNDIDYLVYELATSVNAAHQTGLDANGDPAGEIFTLTAPLDPTAPLWDGAAASISVAISDTSLIATGTTGLAGDNELALTIAELDETASVNGASFTEEYGRIAAKAGLYVSSNEQYLSDSYSLLLDTTAERDAVSGVSTDEEMLKLVQYQTGYEAASRYLSVIQEMLDTLINL